MKTTSFKLLLAGLGLALLLGMPQASFAKGQGGDSAAATFVQSMGNEALTSLTDRNISSADRAARVRTLLRNNFDVPTIARFVLGRGWNTATEAQKAEYQKLFEDMIVKTYTKRFADYSGQAFKVSSASPTDNGDSIVRSQIMQNDGPPVQVDWRVRPKGGHMKVVDVVVEQISMSQTQRSDFESVMGSSGDVEALLSSLRARSSSSGGMSKKH